MNKYEGTTGHVTMQRVLVFSATLLAVLVVLVRDGDGKLCGSMDVRTRVQDFEKLRNCTIIMGYLRVVLFEKVSSHEVYANLSFPELVEVEEFLMVFRVRHLKSIGTLFPNLRVIRGRKLFSNHALIVYRMPDLEEIGLTSLQHIGNGGVMINSCPNLCFGDTVNWEAMGATFVDYQKTTETVKLCENKYCPRECLGNCWNTATCQKLPGPDNCHPQCQGCTKDQSPKHCLACKWLRNYDGECVDTCPNSTVTNFYSMTCLTPNECETLANRTWWIFNNTCINACPIYYDRNEKIKGGCEYVGLSYKKYCKGNSIDSYAVLETFEGCTHVEGSLDIRILRDFLERDLEKYLGKIKIISEYLKVGRSSAIKSLEFLKSLREIKGEKLDNNRYALFVFENQNLQRLWNFTGNFSLTITNGTIAFHDNAQLCWSEIEKLANVTGITIDTDMIVSKSSNGYSAACNIRNVNVTIKEKNPTNVTLSWRWMEPKSKGTIIGFTVYYVPAENGNVTSFENKDACDTESWGSIFVHNDTVQLKYLTPYTRYGYYIKALSTSLESEQTPVYYFNTSSDDPMEPVDFIAQPKNESTIVLTWLPPKLINGKLAYYNITMYLQEDYISTVEQRNYCRNPFTEDDDEEEDTFMPIKTKPSLPTSDNCSCSVENTHRFFTIDRVCEPGVGDGCKKFFYYTGSVQTADSNLTIEKVNIQKRNPLEEVAVFNNTNKNFTRITTKDVNMSTYEITNLRHFSVYIFFLTACNERQGDKEQCSGAEMVSQRTNKSESADNVEGFSVTVNEKNVGIQWVDPEKVNSVIVSYQVELKRTDLEHAKATDECITWKEHQRNHFTYKIFGLAPGKYSVRVRATSLAGPGKFSAWKPFEIVPPRSGMYWIYTLMGIVVLMVVALAAYIGRYWYRKKYALDSNHLITSINPDYAGPIYEEDDWEIDRKDIEFVKALGHGSFGMVYQGMIKSKRYPCAIKTVNESASMPSRMEFLNEGAVMKTFDTPHVIKLLGIVSRGQPPLVIMELMERGDLKSYLRRCRGPSQNLTTNELYRMAAEIADGMAYLSAKKFVHRDLAARNCMVAADRTVKIGDFGMARDIYETDYYRKETVGLLPVRWMAPESLADGVFSSDSDVWSYGIVLWEMATLAEQPYQGFSNEEVFHYVKNKGRLDRPPECPELLYEIMDACWVWRPNDRPTFVDIVDKLVDHVGQDFRLVAFCYSRQGRELSLNAGPRVYNPPAMIVAPEEDFFGRYDASEEEVSLYVKEPSRPSKFLPLSSQRYNKSSPYQISPGSPSSTFSLNSS